MGEKPSPSSEYHHQHELTPALDHLRDLTSSLLSERPAVFVQESKDMLIAALRSMQVERAHDVLAQIELYLQKGQHEIAHVLLSDIIKMQQDEFGQELLQRKRRVGPGLVLGRDLGKFGKGVVELSE